MCISGLMTLGIRSRSLIYCLRLALTRTSRMCNMNVLAQIVVKLSCEHWISCNLPCNLGIEVKVTHLLSMSHPYTQKCPYALSKLLAQHFQRYRIFKIIPPKVQNLIKNPKFTEPGHLNKLGIDWPKAHPHQIWSECGWRFWKRCKKC